MVKLYKDLGKTAKKLLSDDFVCDEKTVELKTKTMNGVTYTTSGKLSGGDNSMSGDLSCKYKVSGASMTSKVTTAGTLSQEAILENTGMKGLKLTALGSTGSKKSVELTSEYIHPHVSAVIKANCIGNPNILSSLSMGLHGVTVGGQFKYDAESKEVKNINGILNYNSGKEHEATLQFINKLETIQFSYSHIISPDFSVAAKFSYKAATSEQGDADKVLTMATKYDIDRETSLKTKLDSAGSLWLSYVQEIRRNTTLTLCTKFDVRNVDKPSQQFGLALAIE